MNSSRSTLRTTGDVLVRAAVLSAGWLAFDRVYTWIVYDLMDYRPIGADIGEGLMAFALVMGVSALWAGWDGWRWSFATVAATWIGSALVAGLVFSLPNPFGSQALDFTWADVAAQLPFMVGLIVLPALLTGGLVAVLRAGQGRAA